MSNSSPDPAPDTLPPAAPWPTAVGSKHIHELSDGLYQVARLHAQRAIANVGATDPLELIDQAFSIGASIELLGKATLAGVDPHLIRGSRSNADTTLALIGRPRFGQRLPLLHTLSGKEAIDLLNRITDNSIRRVNTLDRLFAVRDSAVHLAVVDSEVNDAALGQFARLTQNMLNARLDLGQDGNWDTYWGEQLDAANARLQQGEDAITTLYEQALALARRTYQQRWSASAADHGTLQILEAQAPRVESNELARYHKCPACKSQGWVVYEVSRGNIQVDDSDAPHSVAWFVHLSGQPLYFECNLCRLYLDEDDLDLAEIVVIELDEDEATDEEIELWRDAQYEDAIEMGYNG